MAGAGMARANKDLEAAVVGAGMARQDEGSEAGRARAQGKFYGTSIGIDFFALVIARLDKSFDPSGMGLA